MPYSIKKDPTQMDIKKYLARPIAVTTGQFNSVSAGYFGSGLNLNPATMFQFTQGRLQGAHGFRFTTCWKLQVAATPFQAGCIRMFWSPWLDFATSRVTYPDRCSIMQLPGVLMDICESTSVELRVPWVAPNNYMLVDSAVSTILIGSLHLYAYMPYASGSGVAAPNFTLWMWFEDIELVAASGPLSVATPQANAAPEDIEAKKLSPYAYAFGSLSRSLRLFGGVPIISSFVGPASWASDVASRLCSAFGWSKPLNRDPVQRMQITTNTYQNNCNGPDTTYNTGLLMDAHVQPEVGFAGSDLDEMSFAHITKVSVPIAFVTLSTSDLADQVKYGCAVTPSSFWLAPGNVSYPASTVLTADPTYSFYCSPIFYLSNVFYYWKGCFRFRFRIAKTKFHTGRLLISFTPLSTLDPTGATVTATTIYAPTYITTPASLPLNDYTAIWDLREGNEFTFVTPFVQPLSYLTVNGQQSGNLIVTVLDPLQAPSTVAASALMSVEVSAMPDFELAVTRSPFFLPAPTPQPAAVFQAQVEPEYYCTNSEQDAVHCIGERIMSVKQLISRSCFVQSAGNASITNYVEPFWVPAVDTVSGGVYSQGYNSSTFQSYFSWIYALARGGDTYDFQMIVGPGTNTTAIPNGLGNIGMYYSLSGYAGPCASDGVVVDRGGAHIRAPFYSAYSRVFCGRYYNLLQANYKMAVQRPVIISQGDASGFNANQRAGEDAQLGYLVPTPPMCQPLFFGNRQQDTQYSSNFRLG